MRLTGLLVRSIQLPDERVLHDVHPRAHGEKRVADFLPKFVEAVDAVKIGMPWDADAKITPLCEDEKPNGLKNFIEDALKVGQACQYSDADRLISVVAWCAYSEQKRRAIHEVAR